MGFECFSSLVERAFKELRMIFYFQKNDKFFNHDEIEKLYKNHQNRKIDNSYKLWPILMYKSWKLDNYNE